MTVFGGIFGGGGGGGGSTGGIDDVLAVGQKLTANREIGAAAFNLSILGEKTFDATIDTGFITNSINIDLLGLLLSAYDGNITSTINLLSEGHIRFDSPLLSYGFGDASGGNLPVIDSDATAQIATILDATGVFSRAAYDSFRTLRGSGPPVDGTTIAWFVGQIYADSAATNTLYAATTASTDPDSVGTGSVWALVLASVANIYTTDGSYSATNRLFEGDNVSSLKIQMQDLTDSDFTLRAETVLSSTQNYMGFQIGTGGGGVASQSAIDLNASKMTVVDSINSKGFVYNGDYSTAGSADIRWLPDLGFNDGRYVQNNIFTADGILSGNRTVTGDSDSLELRVFDTDLATFNAKSMFFLSVGLAQLQFQEGVAGVPGAKKDITLSSNTMAVRDEISLKGLEYGADYSTNGSAIPNGRWIPDQAYVDSEILAGPTIYNEDGSYNSTARVFEGNNVSSLTISMMDLLESTFTDRSQMVMSSTQFFMGFQQAISGVVTAESAIDITETEMTVVDGILSRGLINNGDFEDQFVPRSLATKQYVDQVLSSSKIQTIRLKSDLPDPVSGVITSPLNKNLYFIESVDLGTDRLVVSDGGSITGIRNSGPGQTVLSGTTSDPLISTAQLGTYLDIQFEQNGTGDVFDFDPGGTGFQAVVMRRVNIVGGAYRMQNSAFAAPFFNCNFSDGASIIVDANATANFVGLSDASLLSDSADGDILIKVESGATLERLQISSSATVQQNASTGILIEDGATVDFLDLLGAGFNLFNSAAVALQCDDVDAIASGFINDTQFTPGAINLRSSPATDSSFSIASSIATGVDSTILNGNMFISDFDTNNGYTKYSGISNNDIDNVVIGTRLRGITNDGFNIIVADDTTDLVNVMTGEVLPVAFSFATPGSAPRGASFDGEDYWIVDQTDDLIYQMDGLTATVKNSFAPRTENLQAGALDVDGTVVIVGDATNNTFEFYTPTGTFLYDFPSPQVDSNGGTGIAHQEDQYIINAHNDDVVYVYDKNVPFHQGSKTWRIADSNIAMSSTRIVSRFRASGGVEVTPANPDEFTPIADPTVATKDIIWGASATGFEKFLVTDALTGGVKYVGSREMTVVLSASSQLKNNGVALDVEIGAFLNGDLIDASLFVLTLDTNNIFNVTTPSFTLSLKPDDELLIQFLTVGTVQGITFYSGVLSA